MRALSFRGATMCSRAALSTISVSRMWCASQGKAEEAAAKEAKGANTPETAVSAEAYKKLEKEVSTLKETINDLKKDTLYRAADAENARRIGREDVDKAKLYGISSFGKDMLEVADTLEKGIEAMDIIPPELLNENKGIASICTGVKLSAKVLQKNLSKHGIKKMDVAVGSKFDPNFHEALVRTPSSEKVPHESISAVLKTGYTIKDRVLRAAQVGVAVTEEKE